MQFKNYNLNNDISCANETDQFAVSNIKAKLTYPIALLSADEAYYAGNRVDTKCPNYLDDNLDSKGFWTMTLGKTSITSS